MAADRTKVILDTDIGSDIDDAVCLAYLLAQQRCELLGVTTVSGEPDKRAMLASVQCKVAGKKIPIYPGTEAPLIIDQKQPKAPQAAALPKWPHDKDFQRSEAVEFLRRTIRKHPGEITLLTIGPLTNIALLFSIDPEIPQLLKALVLMCGVFEPEKRGHGPLEWNAMCDPHATRIVYRARAKIHRSIGLDVTMQVRMPKDEVRKRFQTKLLRPVLDFAEVWFEHADTVTFHDPLAATTIFDDRICGFEKGTVEVELADEKLAGRTTWTASGADSHHEVALTVDANRFFEHYFGVFE